jgi:hypothetical protein
MPRPMKGSPREAPCPVCAAAAGQPCTYINNPRYRGAQMKSHHTQRAYDAREAAKMADLLLS